MADRTAVIIIDALGYDIAARHGFAPGSLPHRTRLKTVLGFSQAALTSILTGTPPDVHGLWMMYSFTGAGSPFGILGPLSPLGGTDRLWVRRLLDWKLRRVDGIKAYYSLYDVPGDVMRNLDLPARRSTFGHLGGGRRRTVIDAAAASGEKIFVRDYNTPEETAFDELGAALERGETGFNLIYTAGLDSDLHRAGTGGAEIGSRLRRYSDRIDRLAAAHPDTRFIVLGDHGMCDVGETIDLKALIDPLGLEMPGEYVPFYDATMARFRLRNRKADEKIRAALDGAPGGRVLGQSELEELGAFFPAGDFGDVVFLCDPGTIILPSFMGSSAVKGMHGYHPDAPCMFSLMLSNVDNGTGEASITDVAAFLLPGFEGGETGG